VKKRKGPQGTYGRGFNPMQEKSLPARLRCGLGEGGKKISEKSYHFFKMRKKNRLARHHLE